MGQKMSQNQKKGSKNPLGKSTNNSGHENCGNELNELEMEPITWKVFLFIFINSTTKFDRQKCKCLKRGRNQWKR
jgi:hypothetical protein